MEIVQNKLRCAQVALGRTKYAKVFELKKYKIINLFVNTMTQFVNESVEFGGVVFLNLPMS